MKLQINKDNIQISSITRNKLDVENIYIPVFNTNLVNFNYNDYVYKEETIFDNKFSSISGNLKNFKILVDENNKEITTLRIENDYKEKLKFRHGNKKYINKYTKEEILSHIKNYVDDKFAKNLNCENLFISCIDLDPYEANELFYLKDHTEKILETIDALIDIFNIKEAHILISSKESDVISKTLNMLGTYPKIHLKIVEYFYPLGNDIVLKKFLNKNNSCILKASFLFNLYYALKRKAKVTEKYITITGNLVENPKVINVKIGCLISEALKNNIKIKDNTNYICIANGVMSGNIVDINKLIVTNNLRSIIIEKYEEKKEYECINCGECLNVCPLNLNPKLRKKECIKCGLCSYMCPSNINLLKEEK